MCAVPMEPEGGIGVTGTRVPMVASHHVGAGSRTQILWKNNQSVF